MKADAGRLAWMDVAKGLGVLLVVAGHVEPASPFGYAIYAFHMPLFFVLAGAAFSSRPLAETAVRRGRGLLMPYAAFLLLVAAWFPADWRSLVYGGAALSGPFAVFWFPTAMFASLMLYAAVERFAGRRRVLLAATAVGCALAGMAMPGKTPLAVGVAPVGVAFLWFGAVACGRRGPSSGTLAASAAVLAAYVAALAAGWAEWAPFDMKRAAYGPPLAGLVAAGAASLVFAGICRTMAERCARGIAPAFAWMGGASLAVMFLHQPVRFALEGIVAPWPAALLSVGVATGFHLAATRWRPARTIFLGSRD